MNCLLTMRIRDDSENAVYRLAEHILRAQRMAWLSDGITHAKAEELRGYLEEGQNIRTILELETLGRQLAYERSDNVNLIQRPDLFYAGVDDSTVLVSGVGSGSLILEMVIPLAAFIALYIAKLYAKDRREMRQFDARLRTIRAVEKQLEYESLPPKIRDSLLK